MINDVYVQVKNQRYMVRATFCVLSKVRAFIFVVKEISKLILL